MRYIREIATAMRYSMNTGNEVHRGMWIVMYNAETGSSGTTWRLGNEVQQGNAMRKQGRDVQSRNWIMT